MKSRPPYLIFLNLIRGLVPLTHLATPMVIQSECMYLMNYVHFNDFTKSRWPYWNYVLEIEREPGPPSTSGYADGHRVQMYVSITNTGVLAILMIL